MLTPDEQRVVDLVESRRDEVVALLQSLIRFDTTTGVGGDEAALQAFLAARLRSVGAEVEVWEPDASAFAGHPMVPPGFTFSGRPQLLARLRGRGGGRTLAFNGHIDVVGTEPLEEWAHDPRAAVVDDGLVHGRGACDMKGGIASMVAAAEALAQAGIELGGDLVVATGTDEESTGAGGVALARVLEADGVIVTEPTSLDVATACRGSLLPTITVEGRGAHAGLPPRSIDEGGVNAIEKTAIVLDAIESLRASWSRRAPHPRLSAPDCVPTMIAGGEWVVSYPARCRLDCHIEYLPEQADADGWGSAVEREFVDWIQAAAAADPWLTAHPPTVGWLVGGVPPAEVADDDPVVTELVGAARAVGTRGEIVGFDNWHDGATFTVEAGIPAIAFGPGDLYLAHTTSECVPVDDLVRCAQALAVAAMRFCR